MSNNRIALTRLEEHIRAAIHINEVPFVAGSPGIGKSAMYQAVADALNLKFLDFRLSMADFTDLVGLPHVSEGRAAFAPPKFFPLAGDPLPVKADGTDYAGWFISFEEINSAPKSIQAIAYKILHDRMVGDYKLHPAVRLAANGNLDSDRAVTESMSSALSSRMVQYETYIDPKEWLKWATHPNCKVHFDPLVLMYLSFKEEHIHKFDPDSAEKSFACPRTWEKASKFMALDPQFPLRYRASIEGCISAAVTADVKAFIDYFAQVPKVDEIIRSPTTTELPSTPGIRYATILTVANAADTEANFKAIFKYVERFNPEYLLMFLRMHYRKHTTMWENPQSTIHEAVEPYFNVLFG